MKLVMTQTYPQMLAEALRRIDRTHGQPTCFVVPDRFSLEAEMAVLDAMGGTTFDVDVTTFARLADKLTDGSQTALTAEGAAIVVAGIMQEHAAELKCFRGVSGAPELYATISQLMACGVTPEQLYCEQVGALERKLHDIRLVYRAYEAFLARGYRDASSRMREAIDAVPQAEWVRATDFIFVGFDAVTGLNLALCKALDRQARNATFLLVDGDRLFGGKEMQDRLASVCNEVEHCKATLSPLRRAFLTSFGDGVVKDARKLISADEDISLYRASDADAAAEHCAKSILQRVHQLGFRYRDIAVVTSDTDAASRVFDAFGIPHNTDRVLNLSVHPIARMLCDLLECAITHCATASVAKVCYNPMLGVSEQDYASWDSYTLRFGLDRGAHLAPYHAGEQMQFAKDAERREVEADRVAAERVRTLFAKLYSFLPTREATAGTWADALHAVLDAIGLLPSHCEIEDGYRSFDGQAHDRVQRIVDNLRLAPDGNGMTAEECLRLLTTGIAAADVRVTPTYIDAVNVFTPDSFGFRTYRTLIWLGADEGVLPCVQHDCGLLADHDIDLLDGVGVRIDPKICEVNARARMRAYSTLFLSPEVVLITSGGKLQPDFVFRILNTEYLIPVRDELSFGALRDAVQSDRTEASTLYHAPDLRNAKRVFYRLYNEALASGASTVPPACAALAKAADVTVSRHDVEPITDAEKVFFGAGRTSISQIEQYFACPYKHFVEYGLRCKERKEAKVEASDLGNILHAVAERFAASLPQKREDCASLAVTIAEAVMEEDEIFGHGASDVAKEREIVIEESKVLCERLFDFAQSTDFTFHGAEQSFGTQGADYPALDVGVALSGKIDRIDFCDDRAMIIDYKTGFADFSYEHVYYGEQIQLFSYMSVLRKLGYKPSGAFFFPVRNDFGSDTKLKGWVCGNWEDLVHLDRALASQQSSGFLPVHIRRVDRTTGELVFTGESQKLTEAQWEQWLTYTERLLTRAVSEIKDGYIAPRPTEKSTHRPCAYCDAAQSCPAVNTARVRVIDQTVDKASIVHIFVKREEEQV